MDSLLSFESLEEQSSSLTISVLLKGISECRLHDPPMTLTIKEQRQRGRLYLAFFNYLNCLYNKCQKVSFNNSDLPSPFTFLQAVQILLSEILISLMSIKKRRKETKIDYEVVSFL